MSRGVRDLRDLICVSRLTVRESDDEIISDEELGKEFDSLSISSDSGSDVRCSFPKSENIKHGHISPDSGFATNGSPFGNVTEKSSPSDKRSGKKRKKKRVIETLPSRHELPKPPALPPVTDKLGEFQLSSSSLSTDAESSVNLNRTKAPKKHCYDDMLCYMDASIISGWLTRANDAVSELAKFCHKQDNFVQFSHFWLSTFPDIQKHEIFEMEYEILIDELVLAFSVGRQQRKVLKHDITTLATALFGEYPGTLLSSKGNHLFLNYLDILSSERKDEYKGLLSNVRCSTRNKQYAQWLLATRSFALVSFWTAIVNFYRNLTGQTVMSGLPMPSSVSQMDLNYQRLYQAIKLGHVDVLHYLLVCQHVRADHLDSHNRSLVFTAVMHNQEKVLHYLLTRVQSGVNPNQAADTGNTPLHAAANSGSLALVSELLKCPDVEVNVVNPQCEGATPLHLAVMHGHLKVVEALVAVKADVRAKMGDLSPIDIARDFGKKEILDLLTLGI